MSILGSIAKNTVDIRANRVTIEQNYCELVRVRDSLYPDYNIFVSICEDILEGIDNHKFSMYPNIPVIIVEIRRSSIVVRFKYHYCEGFRTFKVEGKMEKVANVLEDFLCSSFKVQKKQENKYMTQLECYWK